MDCRGLQRTATMVFTAHSTTNDTGRLSCDLETSVARFGFGFESAIVELDPVELIRADASAQNRQNFELFFAQNMDFQTQ